MVDAKLVWKRWGMWRAHLYEGEIALCPLPGSNHRRGVHYGESPGALVVLEGAEISAHGIPYGRVCSHCQKIFVKRSLAASEKA